MAQSGAGIGWNPGRGRRLLVSEKDKEKGVDVNFTEVINESMYIRPEFRNEAGFGRNSRSRFKSDMSRYNDYKVRFRAKDPNDPYFRFNRYLFSVP